MSDPKDDDGEVLEASPEIQEAFQKRMPIPVIEREDMTDAERQAYVRWKVAFRLAQQAMAALQVAQRNEAEARLALVNVFAPEGAK